MTANRSALFWGLMLILLGAAFLLRNLGLLPGGFFAWWPLLVLGAGLWLIIQAFAARRGGGLVGGVILATLGTYWLLDNFGRVDTRAFLPLVVIAVGAGLLLRSVFRLN
jgi:hypothetical protein